MRIAVDCRFWGAKHTGLGRYTQNLVENLLKIDKENEYILLFQKEKSLNTQYEIINAPPYSLKEQILLPKVIKKINPDLVHFPHFNVPVLNSFPYVVTIHDLIKHYSKGLETTTRSPWLYLLKYWGYKQVFSQAVKKAGKIIVPSKLVKKELLKYYRLPEDKIKVIYEGADKTTNNKPQIKNDKRILEKYKIKKPYILYVGNVYPHKNIRRLILAVKKINQSLFLKLVIVCGRDVFWQRLKKTIKDFKAERFIHLVGFVPDNDLKPLYFNARAFVSPSLMEGFGLPGLEAMTNNCPVVCSSIPTFKEIYGKAAVYFDPRNIDNICQKILTIINLPQKERDVLIAKGKSQVKKYSWQKCAKQTLEVYSSINVCLS